MARYTGPKHKIARREGINIFEKDSESLKRRLNVPPGGLMRRRSRKRLSEFGAQLREKQRAKASYGLLEKQFRNLVKKQVEKKGDTGEMIISSLETRLDNIVYRLGFAKSRGHARQLVTHNHVLINDRKVNIPSYQVKVNDVISLDSKSTKNAQIAPIIEDKDRVILPFLKREGIKGKLISLPKKEDVQVVFDLQPIIEYYSR